LSKETAVITYSDGSKYEGEIYKGMRDGKGKISFKDGGYYDGYHKNNKINGKGTLYQIEGKKVYEG